MRRPEMTATVTLDWGDWAVLMAVFEHSLDKGAYISELSVCAAINEQLLGQMSDPEAREQTVNKIADLYRRIKAIR